MTNWNDSKSKVSKHFVVKNVTNNDPKRIPATLMHKHNAKKLARHLDKVVDKHGKLVVNSWYRDAATNRRVGGAPKSQHLNGGAVDIKLAYANATKQLNFEKAMDKTWKGGVGRGVKSGKGFTHLDIGPNRRWDY